MMIEQSKEQRDQVEKSLNPYSNGMMIELAFTLIKLVHYGLNPYSNGMMIEQS